jgi:hypothetical protein
MMALEKDRRFERPLLYGICPACKGNISVWNEERWIACLLPKLEKKAVQTLAWEPAAGYLWSEEYELTCKH